MPLMRAPQAVEAPPGGRGKYNRKDLHPLKATANRLMNHKDKWFLIAQGEFHQTVQVWKRDFPEFEFAIRTPEGADTGASLKNKDVYMCFRGTEWYLEQQRKKREKALASTTDNDEEE